MIKNMPDLKKAQIRKKHDVQIIEDSISIPNVMQNIGNGKTYNIVTYGCQANERDSETMNGILELMGYTHNDDVMSSDVILLNTCAIRENAEQKVFGKVGAIKTLKKTNPDIIFGVCGCMAQEESVVNEILTKYPHIDLVFGTHNINQLPSLLLEAMQEKTTIVDVLSQEGDVIENMPSRRENPYKAWVNTMYGCDKFCTYCIVPYTRGKERSRLLEHIMVEVNELKESGYQEITLLGQNVNAYGKDLNNGSDFALLLELVAQSGIPRVRFMTSHPWDFTDDMIDVISKYDNIMPFIHLPVQAGSNEVLKIMNRQYTIEEYIKLFDKLKSKKVNASFSTDIIVGFPNETESQFQQTLDIAKHCQFDNAFTFVYSPRKGTPAAKMEDNVPLDKKKERLQRLNKIINKYMHERNERFANQIVEVLVDGPSKKDENVLSGYSEHNKLVNFKGSRDLIGKIIKVKIIQVKTWSLEGEIIE
ncbi:tRNA (N6-isopentenyl adenosine(37)-C2)-methylthiotransferase MiaB [Mycoplasma sp. P36-A1]|uniref:tRNA (N6-isopentenyl adenosine(37)-C2)-methylthiotransferase MiaB n=1 Tax=Mycoplasma sp. P36-A1 TaxID=3252900 RepID=UPI003C2DC475